MNILFIGTTDILGGAAKVSWEIKTALEKNGSDSSMYVADKRSEDPNVKVIPRSKLRKFANLLLANDNIFATDWLLDTPEYKQADIVHAHNLHGRFFNLGTLTKMSKEKPVVWTLHDEWAITPHCAYTLEGENMRNGLFICPSKDTQPRILWDNTKRLAEAKLKIYREAKLNIVTPCNWLKDKVEKTELGKQPVTVIANGINTKIFKQTNQTEARTKLNLPLDKKIVLFLAVAGKANTWKGWEYTKTVIDSYKNRTDVLFLNVGNFIDIPKENNIEYRKHVANPSELALYYSAADVLLFTSVAENFPLVILEAMATGLPIATFEVGGVAEAVKHKENGYVADYRDSEDLKTGLNWLLILNREERALMSERSIARARQLFDVTSMTDKYLALYNSLLNTKTDTNHG